MDFKVVLQGVALTCSQEMPDHLAEHFHSYWNFHKLSSQLTIQGFVPEKENGLNGSQNHMVKKRENDGRKTTLK